jgi:hypothetical protein
MSGELKAFQRNSSVKLCVVIAKGELTAFQRVKRLKLRILRAS